MAAAPSTPLAVVAADGSRAVAVLLVAAVVLVSGAARGVRAPLLVGAGTELVLAIGFTARALPAQLGASQVVGSVLLAIGMLRERHPDAGFRTRLADLR